MKIIYCLLGCLGVGLLGVGCRDRKPNPADVKALQQVVIQNVGMLTDCYDEGAKTNASLAGKIAVKVLVEEDGTILQADTTMNELGDTVGKCFVAAFKKIKFPKISKTTDWEESFCFEPNPDGDTCKK